VASKLAPGVRNLSKSAPPPQSTSSVLLQAGLAASEVRLQGSKINIFQGVFEGGVEADFTMCNPPFYTSLGAFEKASARKQVNLKRSSKKKGGTVSVLKKKSLLPPSAKTGSNNFGGGGSELWCSGGEVAFISSIISDSKSHPRSRCMWFSSLVSRRENLEQLRSQLKKSDGVTATREIPMGQGHKTSTVLMWSFLSERERHSWAKRRGWA